MEDIDELANYPENNLCSEEKTQNNFGLAQVNEHLNVSEFMKLIMPPIVEDIIVS